DRNDVSGVERMWSALVSRYPDDPSCRVGLAGALYRQGNMQPAVEALRRVQNSGLDPERLLKAADLARRLGESELAVSLGFIAWRQQPQDSQTCTDFALIFFPTTAGGAPFLERRRVQEPSVVAVEIEGETIQVLVGPSNALPNSVG